MKGLIYSSLFLFHTLSLNPYFIFAIWQNKKINLKSIITRKEYGYVFQSSEIYDGLSAVYDYAQNGVELKKNIRDYWWKAMVQMHENIVGIDASILMHQLLESLRPR